MVNTVLFFCPSFPTKKSLPSHQIVCVPWVTFLADFFTLCVIGQAMKQGSHCLLVCLTGHCNHGKSSSFFNIKFSGNKMSPAENHVYILLQNIGIPPYYRITAHKFVRVKFLDYICDMSKWPSFVQHMPCYKWIQTSETWGVTVLFQLGWKHSHVEEQLHFHSGEIYDAQNISLFIYTKGGLSWI